MTIAISTLPPDDWRGENDEIARTMLSGREAARMRCELANAMLPVMSSIMGKKMDLHNAARMVVEFEDAYATRPVANNSGGSGFNDSLWLFVLAWLIRPDRIIESGTHRGHSSWVFRKACPEAEIATFDVSHKMLLHREPDIAYIESDWMKVEVNAGGMETLAFFDDHISHSKRIIEAYERGFRILLMDDNLPVTQLYATGVAPVPTVDMIHDVSLRHGQEIAWTRTGKRYSWRVDENEIQAARELIEGYLVLPDLTSINRYRPSTGLTLLQLVR